MVMSMDDRVRTSLRGCVEERKKRKNVLARQDQFPPDSILLLR